MRIQLVFFVLGTFVLCSCSFIPGFKSDPGQGAVNESAIQLPALGANSKDVTVSGISAGAFMATQLQVAYSSTFSGVGSIAGGPWNCSRGNVFRALGECTKDPDNLVAQSLIDDASQAAAAGDIDPIQGLQSIKVYLFNSPNDSVVKSALLSKTKEFYSAFVPSASIKTESSVITEHTFPTLDYGGDCAKVASPYLGKCGFDGAGEILKHISSPRAMARVTSVRSSLRPFDQTEFDTSYEAANLADQGWIYVPATCQQAGASCSVHVALHGCQQGTEKVDQEFVTHAGYNEWAEGSQMIVIYPQTRARWDNPKGCFDWFGYTGSNYALKSGPQMKAIKAMVDRILSAHQ